jgi:hypothetical protein
MLKLSQLLRCLALSILFGGSAMIVFAVVTLVKEATAKGIPVAEAATNNVPVFVHYSVIALICAVMLLAAESIDFAKNKPATKLMRARWATSLLTVATAMIFGFGIVPLMKDLLPLIKTNEEAHQKFEQLHHVSQADMGAMILFALASIVLPIFDKPKQV